MAQLYAPRSFASSLAKEQDRGIRGYESALAAPPQMGGAAPLSQRVSGQSSGAFGGMQSRYFQQLQDQISSLEKMIFNLRNRGFGGGYSGGQTSQPPSSVAAPPNQSGPPDVESPLAQKVRSGKHGERLVTDPDTGEQIIDFGSKMPRGSYDAQRYGSDKIFMYKGQKYRYGKPRPQGIFVPRSGGGAFGGASIGRGAGGTASPSYIRYR